ncbi:MAG: head GIN domain-containing protein [Breznakibacter sp.]
MKTPSLKFFTLLAVTALTLQSCANNNRERIDGNREYAKADRPVESFSEIEIKGDFDVEIAQGNTPKLSIDADSNLHNYIYTETQNGKLTISQPDNRRLKSFRQIKVFIEAPNINEIKAYGHNRITSAGTVLFDSMRIEVYGATTASLAIKGGHLSGTFPGAVDLTLQGNVNTVDLQFPGAADLNAAKLQTRDFNLKLQGAGKANIFVTENLNVEISGAGLVNYLGNPSSVHSSIGGIGRLVRAD